MSDSIEAKPQNRIKILSAGVPVAPNCLPLAEIPFGDGSRHLGELGDLTYHQFRGGDPPLVCSAILLQSVYRKVNNHLSEDTKREHGGFLLGFESTVGESQTPAIVIVDAVAARFTEGSPVRLTFTTETWRDLDEEIAKRYGLMDRAPQQVGWYHSHPNIRIFLSTWDLDVCTTYQRRQYPVALVVDPINDRGGFFFGGSKGYDPQSPQGFYEVHDLQPAASIVTWNNMEGVSTGTPQSAAGEALQTIDKVGDKRLVIRTPSNGRLMPSPWQIAFRAAFVFMLAVIAGLLFLQYRNGREIDHLNQLVTVLSKPAPVVTPSSETNDVPTDSNAKPSPEININPADPNVTPLEKVQFKADVVGMKNHRVTWSIEPKIGSISATTGLYTAPPTIKTPTTIRIKATGVDQPGNVRGALVGVASMHLQSSVTSAVSVTVTPKEVKLGPSRKQSFQVNIAGSKAEQQKGVKWMISPANGGTVTKDGLYTAPATVPANSTVALTVTSIADPSKSAKASITLIAGPQTADAGKPPKPQDTPAAPAAPVDPKAGGPLSPVPTLLVVQGPPSLPSGQSAQLTISGSADDVTWTVEPNGRGEISANGKYTAPDHVTEELNVRITATSRSDAAKTGKIDIKIKPDSQ